MSTIDFSIRRRDLAWMIAFVVFLSAVWVARGDTAFGGDDPPGEGIDVVYVAVGTNYPDALGVGPGAAINGAPIILVPTNPPLDPATTAELVRLDPQHVVIIGGTSAVSSATELALEGLLQHASFERLAGSNRYETNTLLTQSVYPVEAWASVGALAFGSDDPENDVVDISISLNASVSNETDGKLYANIQLPDGATIIELQFTGFDNHDSQEVEVTMYRVDNAAALSAIATIGSGISADSGNFVIGTTSINPAFEVVENGTYTYLIEVTNAWAARRLHAVRVKYRLGTPGA